MHKYILTLFSNLICIAFVVAQSCPTGNVVLNSQEDVDAFAFAYPDCTSLPGDLLIQENLSGTPIRSLFGLQNIVQVNGVLKIENCTELQTLIGLTQINNASLEGLTIQNNLMLGECGIDALCSNELDNSLVTIYNNYVGCTSIGEIQSRCIDPNCPDRIFELSLLGEFEDHTYFISEERISWPNAKALAASVANGNGYLASIGSAAENQELQSRLANIGLNEDVFIGLSDGDVEGDLTWDDGSPVNFTNYATSYVNTDVNDYGVFNYATGEWTLSNVFSNRFFIVELGCGALAPDLTLSNLTFPDSITMTGSNQVMPYQINVRNIGTQTANTSLVVATYLSRDTILDVEVDSLVGIINTGFLNPFDNDYIEPAITIPNYLEGMHYLISHIDYDNRVEERYEDNNIVVSDKQVMVLDLTDHCLAGNTVIWTQTQLDTLLDQYPDCTVLNGNLTLQATDLEGVLSEDPITSLLPLSEIIWVEGNLNLFDLTELASLEGLNNLEKVAKTLLISNSGLNHLDELAALDTLGGLHVSDNMFIENVNGLNSLEFIYGSHIFHGNLALTSLYELEIGLLALNSLQVDYNPELSTCNSEYICSNLDPALSYTFLDNGPGCENNQEVEEGCSYLYPVSFEIYLDENENGIRDEGEQNYPDGYIENPSTQVRYYMGSNEEVRTIRLASGTYEFFFDEVQFIDWEITTGDSEFEICAGCYENNILVDEELISIGLAPMTTITSIPESSFSTFVTSPKARCFETIELLVSTKNRGTFTQAGQLFIDIDDRVEIISFTDVPDHSPEAGVYAYDISQISAGQTISKRIQVKIPSPEDYEPGTLLSFKSHMLSIEGEIIADYNYTTELKCSYDPNDKAVYPARESNINLIDEYLTYRIRFQNTGNDVAYDVVIRDTLDEDIDLNSFQLLSSEFEISPEVEIREGRFLTFQFDDINLPDSTTNFLGSQGAITYLVRAKEDTEEETIIENTAHIYFDLNPAVVTNTVTSIMMSELPACEINTIFINQQSQIICLL